MLKQVITSVLVTFTILGTMGSIAWNYRDVFINKLLANYTSPNNHPSVIINKNILTDPKIPSSVELSVEDVVKKVNPAVVAIKISKDVPKCTTTLNNVDPFGGLFPNVFSIPSQTCNGTERQDVGGGSGFIVSADGLIVTNRHVVSMTDATYTVILPNGKSYPAQVLARDPVLDVALIKISGNNFPYLTFGNSDTLNIGQSVVAIGNALAQYKNTVSSGIISGLSRTITAGDGMGMTEQLDKVIQTDAAINPGNSGGPLIDRYGLVVGVNVAVAQNGQSIGFALPANSVKRVVDSVKKTGNIVRPYVGIRFVPITKELKEKNKLAYDYGILVQKGGTDADLAVIPGSPADKAGIVENDIVLSIDGDDITNDKSFANIIRDKQVGAKIKLRVFSKGTEKNIILKLEKYPQ